MLPSIVSAINEFENAVHTATKKDTLAEVAEEWRAEKLRALDENWAKVKTARVKLEAMITALREALLEARQYVSDAGSDEDCETQRNSARLLAEIDAALHQDKPSST
jgi:DNA repair exonuclease SbcCD ATPase subunit